VRSAASAAESEALAQRRAREAARARTRETSDKARGDVASLAAGTATGAESGDDIPREDFESATSGEVDGAPVDEAPRWPDEASESAFLAEQGTEGAANGTAVAGSAAPRAVFTPKKNGETGEAGSAAVAADTPVTLPPLQTLVDRIPASARETLEDLFRARFVSVKQIRREALKN
jgi:hypothetical protein